MGFCVGLADSRSTTHVCVADAEGNVVATTQTINGLFGACVQIPGTGMIANNYMFNFDPHPGLALSVEPGKRVFTSMAPMMVRQEGQLRYALGLPGSLRIFPSALQAIVNLLDHGMSLQEAVEAPRLWTEGGPVELEETFPADLSDALRARAARAPHGRRVCCLVTGTPESSVEDLRTRLQQASRREHGVEIERRAGLPRGRDDDRALLEGVSILARAPAAPSACVLQDLGWSLSDAQAARHG